MNWRDEGVWASAAAGLVLQPRTVVPLSWRVAARLVGSYLWTASLLDGWSGRAPEHSTTRWQPLQASFGQPGRLSDKALASCGDLLGGGVGRGRRGVRVGREMDCWKRENGNYGLRKDKSSCGLPLAAASLQRANSAETAGGCRSPTITRSDLQLVCQVSTGTGKAGFGTLLLEALEVSGRYVVRICGMYVGLSAGAGAALRGGNTPSWWGGLDLRCGRHASTCLGTC